MDENEVLMNKLVTRLEADESSIRETVEKVREGKKQETQAITDAEREIGLVLRAAQQQKAQALGDSLLVLEAQTRDYYDRQMRLHASGSEQLKQLEENLFADLVAIRKRSEEIGEVVDPTGTKEGGGVGGQFGRAKKEIQDLHQTAMPLLRSIGLQGLAVGASWGAAFALITSESNQAIARLREMNTLGRSQAFAAGAGGTGFAPAFSGGLRAIRDMTEGMRSPEQIARLAAQFTPILGSGAGGGADLARMSMQAIGMGASYGVSEDIVAKTMVMFRRLEDVPIEQLGNRFHGLAEAALRAGMTVSTYSQLVSEMSENTKRYGIGVDNNMRMVSLFARELQTGIVSIQDLQRLQTAGAGAPAGNRAFWLEQAFEMGLVGQDATAAMGNLTDPIARQQRALRIQQGEYGTAAREQLRTGMMGAMTQWSQQAAGGRGLGEEDAKEMASYFYRSVADQAGFPVGETLRAGELMQQAGMNQKTASQGFLDAAGGFKTAAEAIKEGMKHITGQSSIQQRIWLDVQRGFESFVTQFSIDDPETRARLAGELNASIGALEVFGTEGTTEAQRTQMFQRFARLGAQSPDIMAKAVASMGPGAASAMRLSPEESSYFTEVAKQMRAKGYGGIDYETAAALSYVLRDVLKITVENPADLLLDIRSDTSKRGTPASYTGMKQ